MKATVPAELKQLYRDGRVLPFVGAGVSMSFSWKSRSGDEVRGPSWREMVSEACHILGYQDDELLKMRGTDLQILEFFQEKMGNFAPLTNWLVRRMDALDTDIKSSKLHSALAELKNCSRYYTTNYDDFLERSIELAGRSVQVVRAERDMGGSRKQVEVVKFHGDFNSPDLMVFAENHYYKRMRLDGPLDLKLRSDLFGRVALFLGYSFNDINVGYLFDVLNTMFSTLPTNPTGRRAYIISYNPSDFEISLFRRRNIDIIPAYGSDRALGIIEAIEDMTS